ncbi:MAG: DUF2892 domain-containing protein [Halovenus sp.]
MERNVGGLDRKGRLVAGPVLVLIGVAIVAGVLDIGLTGTVGLAVAALILVVGAIFVVTGTTQKCPANEMVGVNTYDRSE